MTNTVLLLCHKAIMGSFQITGETTISPRPLWSEAEKMVEMAH